MYLPDWGCKNKPPPRFSGFQTTCDWCGSNAQRGRKQVVHVTLQGRGQRVFDTRQYIFFIIPFRSFKPLPKLFAALTRSKLHHRKKNKTLRWMISVMSPRACSSKTSTGFIIWVSRRDTTGKNIFHATLKCWRFWGYFASFNEFSLRPAGKSLF